jgi:hypothetical protein
VATVFFPPLLDFFDGRSPLVFVTFPANVIFPESALGKDEALRLDEAMRRRMDWTPPRETAYEEIATVFFPPLLDFFDGRSPLVFVTFPANVIFPESLLFAFLREQANRTEQTAAGGEESGGCARNNCAWGTPARGCWPSTRRRDTCCSRLEWEKTGNAYEVGTNQMSSVLAVMTSMADVIILSSSPHPPRSPGPGRHDAKPVSHA